MTETPLPNLTIVSFGSRFTVESDQFIPDPVRPRVSTCLLLTSKGTLAKSGDSWATREGAEKAIARYRAKAAAKTFVLPAVLRAGEDGGVVAECPLIPGCISQGSTREEALANIREAIEVCLPEYPNLASAEAVSIKIPQPT